MPLTLHTVDEIAQALGISRKNVYRGIHDSTLEHYVGTPRPAGNVIYLVDLDAARRWQSQKVKHNARTPPPVVDNSTTDP